MMFDPNAILREMVTGLDVPLSERPAVVRAARNEAVLRSMLSRSGVSREEYDRRAAAYRVPSPDGGRLNAT